MKLSQYQIRKIRRRLRAWYRAHRRPLPWRRNRDPYRIWVAEIMLQQTRIAAVIPYYERFLSRFPTVKSLARARKSEVLKHWAGLGYYCRARNLHRAAKIIMQEHEEKFPRALEAALALPGIGSYTASAILSIAYDVPLAALDGNVARVLARLVAFRGNVRENGNRRKLSRAAQTLLPKHAPGDWNQALMELGETICTPRSPNCQRCPLARSCKAYALGLAETLPTPRKKSAPIPVRIAAAVFVDRQGRTLLTKTPGQHDAAVFSRMWQFPAIQIKDQEDAARLLARHLRGSYGIKAGNLTAVQPANHSVTFRRLTLLPFLLRVARLPLRAPCKILPLTDLSRVPISNATRRISGSVLATLEP